MYKANLLSQTFPSSSLHFFFLFLHHSLLTIFKDAYILCHDLCLALEMQGKRIINIEHVGTTTKTGKRLWWEERGSGSQADLSLPPGSTVYQEVTDNPSCHPPSVRCTVRGSYGELLRSKT